MNHGADSGRASESCMHAGQIVVIDEGLCPLSRQERYLTHATLDHALRQSQVFYNVEDLRNGKCMYPTWYPESLESLLEMVVVGELVGGRGGWRDRPRPPVGVHQCLSTLNPRRRITVGRGWGRRAIQVRTGSTPEIQPLDGPGRDAVSQRSCG